MIFLAPINVVVFSIVGKMRRKVLKYSDLRVKMMNEILSGIRIIKFYAWEKPFKKEVGMLREKELKALTNLAYVSAVGFSLILLSAPIIQVSYGNFRIFQLFEVNFHTCSLTASSSANSGVFGIHQYSG